MITLFTGLPGNAKTLKVLQWLQKKALAENRDVYYSGINECRVPSQVREDGKMSKPWVEIDPKDWMSVPDGALIVIDEAQDTFEKMNSGVALPEYYKMLAKHRHTGKDLVLVTQHPSLIHNFALRLVQQHFHAIRKFGMSRSTYYEWDKVAEHPERITAQKSAVSVEKFAYPVEIFDWYTSASQHTVKRRVPLKLIIAVLLVVSLLSYAGFMVNRFVHKNDSSVAIQAAALPGAVSPGKSSPGGQVKDIDALSDAKKFVFEATPRIAGLPQTAPKYDELTKPVRVPVPAMCIQKGSECRCLSQQATRIEVPPGMCVEFARNGFFQEFDADKDRVADARTSRGADVLASSPVGRPVTSLAGPSGVIDAPPAAPTPPAPPVDNGLGRRPGTKSASNGSTAPSA